MTRIEGVRIAGVSTCVPSRSIDNLEFGARYGATEVRKIVSMAGIRARRVVDPGVTAADLCFEAASRLLERLNWAPDSITGLILVTQSPDYFLPSSSCLVHKWLGLNTDCAAFDVGLGCSGYPYGLYLAASMLKAGGQQRILMLNGDTPSLFTDPEDHATTLLFGDAGAATALELGGVTPGYYALHTDGKGYAGLIIPGGGFRNRAPADPRDLCLSMDGAGVFGFTLERVPRLVGDTLAFAGLTAGDIDQFFFHQSNQFMMRHLIKKCGIADERVPFVLDRFGNAGGASVALAITQGMQRPAGQNVRGMMLGYGVGLSWGAAIVDIDANAVLAHSDYSGTLPRA